MGLFHCVRIRALYRISECAGTQEQCSEAEMVLWGRQNIFLSHCFVANAKMFGFIDIYYFNSIWKYWFIIIFLPTRQVLMHSVRGPIYVWEALPPCERLGLPLRGQAHLWKVRPLWENPGLHMRSKASLWEARPSFERTNIPVRDETQPLCERQSVTVGVPTSLWEAWPLWETRPFCDSSRFPVRGPASLLWHAPLWEAHPSW